MRERDKWDLRYQDSTEPFYGREPSAFLARSLPLLPPPGRCLDLGGGQGRNAVFLAGRGWEVTLVDVALAGVARARAWACATRVGLAGVVADLDEGALAIPERGFDLVLAVNYHDHAIIGAARTWLRPGGALLVEGFAQEQLGRSSGGPQNPALLWRPNELLTLAGGLRVVWYEDRLTAADDNPRHRGEKWVVRLIARRTA
ncbi:MAG: class I SAM-dependent methyltransferase [Myxococcaceae bacterium]